MIPHGICSRPGTDLDSEKRATKLVSGVVTATTLTVAFTLLALGVEHFWVTFILGFGVVLPTATGLTPYLLDEQSSTDAPERAGEDDAIATLRRRYARGELTDAEFEEQVERLLETEARRGPDDRL